MTERTIFIEPDGTVKFLSDEREPLMEEQGNVTKSRASHVVPLNRAKRTAFRLLRWAFGEKGRTADWTRRWSGPWKVQLIGSDRTFVSQSRQECIDWEVHTLNKQMWSDG